MSPFVWGSEIAPWEGSRGERTRTHISNGLEVLGASQEVPQVPTSSIDRIRKGLA